MKMKFTKNDIWEFLLISTYLYCTLSKEAWRIIEKSYVIKIYGCFENKMFVKVMEQPQIFLVSKNGVT